MRPRGLHAGVNSGHLYHKRDALSHAKGVMPPSVCPRRAVPSKIMCTVQWASNLHLLPQFTFLSTFFFSPNTCFRTKLPGTCRRKGLGEQAVYLELNAFFASRPKADKHFLQPPDWGCGVLTQKGVGLCGCVSLQLPGCPRPDEERKGIIGTRGRHKNLIGVKGLPSRLSRSQGRAVWATPVPGEAKWPLSDSQIRAQASGSDLPFLLPARRIPAPPAT